MVQDVLLVEEHLIRSPARTGHSEIATMHSSAQDSVPTARRQRMRRPTHSCLLVAALILAAWQSAHASSQLDVPTDAGAAAKGSPQAPVPAPGHGTAEANLLFVQQAGSAELIFDSPDTATDQARLVLHNVAPSTTWCCFLITCMHAIVQLVQVSLMQSKSTMHARDLARTFWSSAGSRTSRSGERAPLRQPTLRPARHLHRTACGWARPTQR